MVDGFAIEGGWVDLARHAVLRGGISARLTGLEARLLRRLALEAPKPMGHPALLDEVWGHASGVRTQSLEQAVRRVRVKLEVDPSRPRVLLTERGLGYRLVVAHRAGEGLTPPRDAFFGRASERQTLTRWLTVGSARVLTIKGLGGMGKTRLATEFAWSSDDVPRLGFVDLSEARCAADVEERTLDALGALSVPVGQWLSQREGLLVLDNVEQVIDAFARQLDRWLDEAPRVRFLVTSREHLGIRGERVLTLGPLSPAAGVALLRARRVDLVGSDEALLMDLARHLDGIPLALELAAATLSTGAAQRDLHALEGWLTRRGPGRRSRPDRQATLEASLSWSWHLLGPDERSALIGASVFRGGFSAADLEAVVGPELEVGEALQRLVNQSMVRVCDTGAAVRFALFDVVRAFAQSREDVTRERFAARHLALFSRLGMPDGLRAIARHPEALVHARTERDNLEAAARWALATERPQRALPPVLALVALTEEEQPATALGWLERVAGLELEDGEARALTLRRAQLLVTGGRPIEAIEVLVPLGDDLPAVDLVRGRAYLARDALDRARVCVHRACEALEDRRDHWLLGEAMDVRATVDARQGDFIEAARGHEEALRVHERSGNVAATAATAANLAGAAHRAGDGQRAAALYRRAADTARRFGRRGFEIEALAALAGVWVYSCDPQQALGAAQRAVALADGTGNAHLEAQAWAALGEALVHAGAVPGADESLTRAREAAVLAGRPFLKARVDSLLGEVLRRSGRLPAARAALERAAATFAEQDQALALTMVWCRRGLLHLAHGDGAAAASCHRRARLVHTPRGHPTHPAVCFELARLAAALAPRTT